MSKVRIYLLLAIAGIPACSEPEVRRAPEIDAVSVTAEPGALRRAIEKPLPLLQQSARTWFEFRACQSCHHQSLGSMTMAVARERGFAVDEPMLAEQIAEIGQPHDGSRESILEGDAGINAQIGQSYKLLALATAGVAPSPEHDARVHLLAGKQQRDGHWPSESHRPPLEDSEFTATALASRAIQLYPPPGRAAEIAERVARAHAWLLKASPGSNEERTMQLFGLAWTGGMKSEVSSVGKALLREQREDGGWAQIATRPSDAYATGQALVALQQVAGLAVTDAAYRRGVEFLLRTQLADGTWQVRTRRKSPGLTYFETGFPHGEDQFISYAATCWALMALCFAVDPSPSPTFVRTEAMDRRAIDPRAPEPADGVTPLMLATLYEDPDAMQALLDAGADVNAHSHLGLTALMCAPGDVAKAKLLLDHGADPNLRTQRGATPALLAATYDGGYEVLKLLLEHGADPEAHTSEGFRPLMGAALSGDFAKIDLLLDDGVKIDAADEIGLTALTYAAAQGDAATVRHLLEHGAAPDPKEKESGCTPLFFAVIDGLNAVVHVLLSNGAEVDARDADGFTPLIWASTVDFGDSVNVESLISRGADVRAHAPGGETALKQALSNGNASTAMLLLKAGADQ